MSKPQRRGATSIRSGKQKRIVSNAAPAATLDPIYDRRQCLSEIKRKQPDKEPNANATRWVPQSTRRGASERGHNRCGRGRAAQFALSGWAIARGRCRHMQGLRDANSNVDSRIPCSLPLRSGNRQSWRPHVHSCAMEI